MRLKTRAFVATAASAIAVSATMIFAVTPAQAAATCTAWQEKSFSTPGYNTDLRVKLCVDSGYDYHSAYILASWTDGGSSATDGNRKFDKLRLHYRLERYDADYATSSCSIAGAVNTNESGSASCPSIGSTSSLNNGWSADGWVEYDIDRDGNGSYSWSLKGTPTIY